MNPNFRRMPADANVIRRNYLANLALQISNNQKNWNANQIFQTTGVTPTEPSDPRSRTDIGANIEDMKVQLRQALASKITDWANANRVVDTLDNAADVSSMLDMLPKMATDLLPSYKSGVPADVLLKWWRTQSHIRDQQALTGLDLSQQIGMDSVLSGNAIQESMATRGQVDRILDILGRGFGAGMVAEYRGSSGNGLNILSSSIPGLTQQATSAVASGDANQATELLDSILAGSAEISAIEDNDSYVALQLMRSGGGGGGDEEDDDDDDLLNRSNLLEEMFEPEPTSAGGGGGGGAAQMTPDRTLKAEMTQTQQHLDRYLASIKDTGYVSPNDSSLSMGEISSLSSITNPFGLGPQLGPLGQFDGSVRSSPYDVRQQPLEASSILSTPHKAPRPKDYTQQDFADFYESPVRKTPVRPPRVPPSQEGAERIEKAVEQGIVAPDRGVAYKSYPTPASAGGSGGADATVVGKAFGRTASMTPGREVFTPITKSADVSRFYTQMKTQVEKVDMLSDRIVDKRRDLIEAMGENGVDPEPIYKEMGEIAERALNQVEAVREESTVASVYAQKLLTPTDHQDMERAIRRQFKTMTNDYSYIQQVLADGADIIKKIRDARGPTQAQIQQQKMDRLSQGKSAGGTQETNPIGGFGVRLKGRGVQGVPASQPYVSMGKHFIHKHKLIHDGILQIRRKSGTTINHLPTQKISKHLATVLLKLIGNDHPSFEDMQRLADSDKALMNKIIKNTKIDDRLMLPTPERTEEEQEWNRFQVLVGETHAGNNSPELIKELKGLLLKMAHTNRLPKGQVREILMDLTAMGH